MLATPQWLIAHHRDANVRVIDPRQPTDYDKGHVPGAVNANTPFKDPDRPLHVMTPAQAEAAIRALGISGDTTAVIAGIGMLSGRIWWFLRYHGLADVRILDAVHRQVPYVIEHREEPLVAAMNPEPGDPPATAPGGAKRSNWSSSI